MSLAVDAAGDLTVTAPPRVPLARLDDVVRTKAPWVVEKVKRASDRPPPVSRREFVTGETVRYLGRQYRLKVVRGPDKATTLRGGWIVVQGPASNAARVRAKVAGWLRERAERYLPKRLGELCSRHMVEEPAMVVGEQKARWGSCDARGTVRINWRIVQAPVSLVDYVLLHEVTHLVQPAHDDAFWAALGRKMPDYERRRDRLRVLGADLVW